MWYKIEGESQDGGAVISAEEGGGAAIIWEEDSMLGPYSITFGIYGVGFHTVRYINREDAYKGYVAMKQEYQNFIKEKTVAEIIINKIPLQEIIKEYEPIAA